MEGDKIFYYDILTVENRERRVLGDEKEQKFIIESAMKSTRRLLLCFFCVHNKLTISNDAKINNEEIVCKCEERDETFYKIIVFELRNY
jgi:hypothetical protein